MKKFLAVLLAVALLGVAGAAFAADDASHTGHTKGGVSSDDLKVPTTLLDDFKKDFDDGKPVNLISFESLDKTAVVAKHSDTTQRAGLPKISGLVVGEHYAMHLPSATVSTFSGCVPSSLVLYTNDSSVVSVAAANNTAKFREGTTGEKLSTYVDMPSSVYMAFTADATTVSPVIEGTPKSNGPTSNKGSGGCNAGFAGIAVLALSLAALRRKAR